MLNKLNSCNIYIKTVTNYWIYQMKSDNDTKGKFAKSKNSKLFPKMFDNFYTDHFYAHI